MNLALRLLLMRYNYIDLLMDLVYKSFIIK